RPRALADQRSPPSRALLGDRSPISGRRELMATPKQTPRGWRYQFTDHLGNRQFVSWPRCSQRAAYSIAAHIDELVGSIRIRTTPPPDTRAWVADAPEQLINRLAELGLCAPRVSTELAAFVDRHLERRANEVKHSTILTDRRARRHLLAFFDGTRDLASITRTECADFRAYLLADKPEGAGLATNTANTTCRLCSQFFTVAIAQGLTTLNPFAGLPKTTKGNPEAYEFVDRDRIERLLMACPDAQWRTMIVLARYGGLRCPSEVLSLRWADISWDTHRFLVRAPKTEHHRSGGIRRTPLFPEIAHELRALQAEVASTDGYVITRYRTTSSNLRTQLSRFIHNAGIKPWPKLWSNMRASRHMELKRLHPSGIVNEWIGHNERVAAEFYEHATDADFAAASCSLDASQPVAKPVASGIIKDDLELAGTAAAASGSRIGTQEASDEWAQQDSNL
ncbi:MAG: tyrosine-type recombinase/integrase, partial [Planctomycetota bacterium]